VIFVIESVAKFIGAAANPVGIIKYLLLHILKYPSVLGSCDRAS
jgi:hypothetical protein